MTKFDAKMTDFKFTRPLEAPVFTPTAEEFKDPLAYLNKIRPQAERAGICKIKPPSCWQPPFAVDVDCFKFTPRIQRLNELEAKTRIKLNFLDQIAKFWELQGSSLKIPIIDKKALDLYSLHKLVQSDGGPEKVNNEKKWNRLATRMGYPPAKNYGLLLKSHYDKLLYPFDLFATNKMNAAEKDEKPVKKGTPMKSKGSPVKAKTSPTKVTAKAKPGYEKELEDQGGMAIECTSKELRRLAFYGAGPKMAGFNSKSSQNLQLNPTDGNGKYKNKTLSMHDPLAKYICLRCKKGDSEDCMLLCDGCDDSYHTFCLLPPLPEVPKGEWRCPQCVAEEVSKPSEAFGFEQAQREYTLQQFGEMADQFKSEYFNTPVHMVESEVVEREFWRIVSAIDEDVTVEYGADLHTMDHGSGFPTEGSSNILPGDEVYIKSGWNLNNLPVLAGSVLGHINADISGMKVPWMYVGMCFATFCWHNEDHWSYSINYLHWGEPKTWYGVPGSRADDFENAMKQAAPELFQSQPDLLHQLVTIMNPNILMKAGVPVYRMDQRAGEFIVTFPRAYHAGFNQGYNFAEAVNFAPPDWLAMGRSCIDHYSTLHRYCVFAHDELVCKMSTEANDLTLMVAMATYKDLLTMGEAEREFRKVVSNWGVTKSERKAYELLPDDERLCDFCKTTCFLSTITCSCTNRLSCLRHYDKLCECPPSAHTLMYRYTLDEIPAMMAKLKERTVEYNDWVAQLEEGLNSDSENKLELEELKELLLEAETRGYPKTPLRDSALTILEEAEKCVLVAQKLVHPAVKTRTRNMEDGRLRVRVTDLEMFADQMDTLSVKIKEVVPIRLLLANIKEFKENAKDLLAQQDPNIDELKSCMNAGIAMDFDLDEIRMLQSCLDRTKWIQQVDDVFESECLWTLDYLDKTIETGESLEKMDIVEVRLRKLRTLKSFLVSWEDRATHLMGNLTKCRIKDFEALVLEAKRVNIALPSLPSLRNMLKKAREYAIALKLANDVKEVPFSDLKAAARKRTNSIKVEEELDEVELCDDTNDEDLIKADSAAKGKRKSGKSPVPSRPSKIGRSTTENSPKKTRKRKNTGDSDRNGNEEYNEDCAADPCRQPAGKEVNWVQCDIGCELWFHLVCVGVKKSEVNKMEHYQCDSCKGVKSTSKGKNIFDENSRGCESTASKCEVSSISSSNKENACVQRAIKQLDIKLDDEDDEKYKSTSWLAQAQPKYDSEGDYSQSSSQASSIVSQPDSYESDVETGSEISNENSSNDSKTLEDSEELKLNFQVNIDPPTSASVS